MYMFLLFSSSLYGVTVNLETLSLLYSSQNTNQITNGLVWIGSFDSNLGQTNQAARPDTGGNTNLVSIFSTNASTTRSNLTSSFKVFAEGAVLEGGVKFVGREYSNATNATTSTNGAVEFIKSYTFAPTFTNTPSLFLLIFNEATVESATEMLIFRPAANPDSGIRPTFPEGDDNLLSIALEASSTGLTFFELFFGTWGETALENNPNFSGFFRSASLNQTFGITSSSTASATNGTPFTYQILANNGPISYAAAGMPGGLEIDTVTGLISGVPNDAAKSYTIVLQSVGGTVTSTQTHTLTLSDPAGSPPTIVTTTNVVNLFAGVAYPNAYTIDATTTNAPITSYGASNLPSGLSVNTNTGLISGMPTQLVTNRIIPISAYNGATGYGQFTLTINSPPLAYPTLTFTAGSSSNSPVPTVTAGYSPTSFTASNLPTGLSINSSGVIQGTPTIGGTISTSTITAVNASGVASSVSQVITVNTLRPTINSAPVYTILNRTNATPYVITTTLTSTVVAPSSFSVSRGSLPTGMSLNTSSGVISGTPVSGKGIVVVGLRADNASANGSPVPGGGEGAEFDLTIRVDVNPPVFTRNLRKNCAAGFALNANNNFIETANNPETFSLSGAPSWLSIANDGKISGKPPNAGEWTIPVTIANTTLGGLLQPRTENLTITATATPPSAASLGVQPGTFILNQNLAVTYSSDGFFLAGRDLGANAPTAINVLGLPPGVTFASNDDRRRGLLTGTPTQVGTYPCTVYVRNAKGFTRSTMTFKVIP